MYSRGRFLAGLQHRFARVVLPALLGGTIACPAQTRIRDVSSNDSVDRFSRCVSSTGATELTTDRGNTLSADIQIFGQRAVLLTDLRDKLNEKYTPSGDTCLQRRVVDYCFGLVSGKDVPVSQCSDGARSPLRPACIPDLNNCKFAQNRAHGAYAVAEALIPAGLEDSHAVVSGGCKLGNTDNGHNAFVLESFPVENGWRCKNGDQANLATRGDVEAVLRYCPACTTELHSPHRPTCRRSGWLGFGRLRLPLPPTAEHREQRAQP